MKLSIITINRNNAEGLCRTMESVLAQTYRDFEYIIVDGASTDGSVDVIQECESANRLSAHPVTLTWVSEPDKGIYDAMNKGIEIASGDYLYFLNGGDTLYEQNTLSRMIAAIDGSDFIVGRVDSLLNGNSLGLSAVLTESDYTLYQMYLRGISHQSVLIKRSVQEQYPYDTSFRLCADWKFFVQTVVLRNATVKNTDVVYARFDRSGVSSAGRDVVEERLRIVETTLPKRLASDYLHVLPHYYEVVRIEWLLNHPFFYRVYRGWTTLGRKLFGKKAR